MTNKHVPTQNETEDLPNEDDLVGMLNECYECDRWDSPEDPIISLACSDCPFNTSDIPDYEADRLYFGHS